MISELINLGPVTSPAEDVKALGEKFEKKLSMPDLDIKDEIKAFIDCVESFRSILSGDNIKVKLVKDLDDLFPKLQR